MKSVGIVGCGLMGEKRAAAAVASGLEIMVAADSDAERARALLRKLSPTGRAVADWREAIAMRPDLVVVATTHDVLPQIAAAAAREGSHVLVEKPAARSCAELKAVIEAAEAAGVTVKVGFNHRFHPALLKARDLVDSGAIGPLMYVRGRYGHGGRLGYEREWRCDPKRSGGGELIDQGSHLIDLSRWFLGDFTEVHGIAATMFWQTAVDDNCFIDLRTARGQIAWLHASWTEWKNLFSFEIYGRQGKIQIDGLGGSYGPEQLTYYQMEPKMGPPLVSQWQFPGPDRSWEAEFAELIAAVVERRQPIGNLHDAYANLLIIEKLYQPARS